MAARLQNALEHVLKDMHLSTRAVYDIMDVTSDSKAGK